MKALFLVFTALVLCLTIVACGGGNFNLDPTKGEVSTANGSGENAETYFKDNLFPLMKGTISNAGTGCAAASPCHGTSSSAADGYFRVNPDSADDSWQWAKVRRIVVTQGPYANSSARLINDRAQEGHNNFTNWTAEQKALVEHWTNNTQ